MRPEPKQGNPKEQHKQGGRYDESKLFNKFHPDYLHEQMKLVKLTKGFHACVDDEDYEFVVLHRWCASIESRGTKVYAIRWKRINGKRCKIRMHHFVLGIAPGTLGDHVIHHLNDDGLDNRKCNLEKITQEQNMASVERWQRKGKKVCEPCL